jgi:hypothetical protein
MERCIEKRKIEGETDSQKDAWQTKSNLGAFGSGWVTS